MKMLYGGDVFVDDCIKNLVQTSPGLSADRILHRLQHHSEKSIFANHLYKCLRQLKRQGVLINKGNRWYVNTKHQSIRHAKVYSGG
jgi:Fe2+ or Zn2+ uptake regulation protein